MEKKTKKRISGMIILFFVTLAAALVLIFILAQIFLLKEDSSPAAILSNHAAVLSEGEEFVFDGFRLGDSYKQMERRMKTSSEITPRIMDYGEEENFTSVEFQCIPEAEGSYNGFAAYHFREEEFIMGHYSFSFLTLEGAMDYSLALDAKLAPLADAIRRNEYPKASYLDYYFTQQMEETSLSLDKQTLNALPGTFLDEWEETQTLTGEEEGMKLKHCYQRSDGTEIIVTVMRKNVMIYGEEKQIEAEVSITYQEAEWNYPEWREGLKPSVETEGGEGNLEKLEKARNPEWQYEEAIFDYLSSTEASFIRVDWISQQDERWKPEWGTTMPLAVYEKEDSLFLNISEDCRFLIMLNPVSWADVPFSEFIQYLKRSGSPRWEIGYNEQGELMWVMEGMLP